MSDNDIAVKVGADISALKRELGKGSQTLDKFRGNVNDGAKATAKYSAAAVTAGAAIATHLVKQSLAAIDSQAKLAQQLNTSSSSLATLKRAGELSGVSMQQISVASRTLSVRLGEVKAGTGEAVEAFKRLKLDADEIAELPLDKRIEAINKAMAENIPVTERAALAADLFGARASTAMKMLSSENLQIAREEMELFGLALSDVDAAKVEQANDAMSVISKATEGIIQQFTVQLSPILKAVSNLFKKNAKEAGGVGESVKNSFNKAIDVVGFLADAIEGVRRVTLIMADGIVAAIAGMVGGVQALVVDMVSMIDKIPGIDMSGTLESLNSAMKDSEGVVREAVSNIQEILSAPMPSENIRKLAEEAQIIAQEQAEATVAAREQEVVAVTEHQEKLTAAEQRERNNRLRAAEREAKEKRQITTTFFSNMASLMQSGNKKQFEIGKKAAIAGALVTGYSAAVEAYKGGLKVSGGNPAIGATFAAASLAATGAQISAIRSQSFGGGGAANGGSVGNYSPDVAGGAISSQASQQTNITVSGIDPSSFVQAGGLIEAINSELGDGATLGIA